MKTLLWLTRIAIPLALIFVGSVLALVSGRRASKTVRGRLLEGCSCSVPCVCNVGGVQNSVCESLAFFEIERGSVDKIDLKGLRFGIADRGGFEAIIYVDSALQPSQKSAIRKLAQWIVSQEGTPISEVVEAPIQLEIGNKIMSGSVVGTPTHISGVLLLRPDGHPSSVISHPRIFGAFPVLYAEKGVSKELVVQNKEFSFTHSNTNLNNGVFEFAASKVVSK